MSSNAKRYEVICTKCNTKFIITHQAKYLRNKKNLPLYCPKCMKEFISNRARETALKKIESMTPEEYKAFLEKSNWHAKLNDEEKAAHSQRTKDQLKNRTKEEWDAINKKNSEGLKKYWQTVSDDEKKQRVEELHEALKKVQSEYTKEDWKRKYAKRLENMTPEQRDAYRQAQVDKMIKYNESLSLEEKQRRAQCMQDWHARLTPEQKKELYERTHAWTNEPGMKEKISQQKKEYWENLPNDIKMERIKKITDWYASLSDDERQALNDAKKLYWENLFRNLRQSNIFPTAQQILLNNRIKLAPNVLQFARK